MTYPRSTEPTRYELAMEKDGAKYLVSYSMRTGRHSLLTALRNKGADVLYVAKLSEDALLTWNKPASAGALLGDWRVYWTRRTQRQAIQEGELPFVCGEAARLRMERPA
jgi:hypothetical protein